MASPKASNLLEQYEILGPLGKGGMASLYKVRHRLLDEIRVLKRMDARLMTHEEFVRRFHREARFASRLRHPNIASLFEVAVDENGHAVMLMEYIRGITLNDLFRAAQSSITLDLALNIGLQILEILAFLHGNRHIHRDIAPDNLMITVSEKGEPRIKLIDLGIAKDLESTEQLTRQGSFIGKIRYCAPE